MESGKSLINLSYNHISNEEFKNLYFKLTELAEKIGQIVSKYHFRRTINDKMSDALALVYISRQKEKFSGGFGIWLDEKAFPPVFNINVNKDVKIRNYYYRIWDYIIEKQPIEELSDTVETWLPQVIDYYNNIAEKDLKERGLESTK